MFRRTFLIAAIAAAAACRSGATARPERSPTMDNKETIRRLYEDGINHGRWELLPALVDESYVGPKGERGPEGFRASAAALKTGVPDIQFTLRDLVAEDDRVAVRFTWTGTHTGALQSYAASGRSVTAEGMAIYSLRAGKIVAAALVTDRLGVLQQIGVAPR